MFELLLLIVVGYGFTYAAPRPNGSVDGSAGYTASSIVYTLDSANPTLIASVRFTLDISPDLAGSTVRAKLAGAGTSYVTCAPTATSSWECPFAGVAVARADHLTVDVVHAAVSPQRRIYLPFVRR